MKALSLALVTSVLIAGCVRTDSPQVQDRPAIGRLPNDDAFQKKRSYDQGFEPYPWVIGPGIYLPVFRDPATGETR
jgi:hypothetical protein